jgi:hypothetical protein
MAPEMGGDTDPNKLPLVRIQDRVREVPGPFEDNKKCPCFRMPVVSQIFPPFEAGDMTQRMFYPNN